MATWTPETIAPARIPSTAYGPKRIPAIRGTPMTRRPGAIMYLREAVVEMEIAPL
jgi:hypothetical protein